MNDCVVDLVMQHAKQNEGHTCDFDYGSTNVLVLMQLWLIVRTNDLGRNSASRLAPLTEALHTTERPMPTT